MRFALVMALALMFARPMSASPLDTSDFHALRAASGECLDGAIQNKPLVLACEDNKSQLWKLTPLKDGYYQLTSKDAGPKRCLDIINDGENNRLRVTDCANATGQHWKFTPAGSDFTLTTEWRGDKKCLAVTGGKPVLADCADVPGQHWKFTNDAAHAGLKFDGEIAVPTTFTPTFLILFVKDCPLGPSDQGDSALFRCTRSAKKTMTCTIRRVASAGELFTSNTAPDHALEAAIATDTASALSFGAGAFQIKANLKTKDVVLTQRSVSCKGSYLTPTQWEGVKKDVLAQMSNDASDSSGESSSPRSSSSSSSSSHASTPTRKKGLDRGRMCGRDSECDSGSCKMENKTRGRCS